MIQEINEIYTNYFLLLLIIIFAISYYVVNKNFDTDKISKESLTVPVLSTVIIMILIHLVSKSESEPKQKTYKITNIEQQGGIQRNLTRQNGQQSLFIAKETAQRMGVGGMY